MSYYLMVTVIMIERRDLSGKRENNESVLAPELLAAGVFVRVMNEQVK